MALLSAYEGGASYGNSFVTDLNWELARTYAIAVHPRSVTQSHLSKDMRHYEFNYPDGEVSLDKYLKTLKISFKAFRVSLKEVGVRMRALSRQLRLE